MKENQPTITYDDIKKALLPKEEDLPKTMEILLSRLETRISEIAAIRNEIDDYLLKIDIKQKAWMDEESKMIKLVAETMDEWRMFNHKHYWHTEVEEPDPEREKEYFLALTEDYQPFITHYMEGCGWLPQVYLWKYIELPV